MKAVCARPEVKAQRSAAMKAQLLNPEFREKQFQAWVARSEGGLEYPGYYRRVLPLIRDRAKHRCEYCGGTHDFMEVHHIDHRTLHNRPENLIYLCRRCHTNYGHNDAGRPDFERIAPERSLAMPIGWHEALIELMSYAERWNRAVYGCDLYGRAL